MSVDLLGAARNWEAIDRTSLRGSTHRRVTMLTILSSSSLVGREACSEDCQRDIVSREKGVTDHAMRDHREWVDLPFFSDIGSYRPDRRQSS